MSVHLRQPLYCLLLIFLMKKELNKDKHFHFLNLFLFRDGKFIEFRVVAILFETEGTCLN